jgi:DNA transformation protein
MPVRSRAKHKPRVSAVEKRRKSQPMPESDSLQGIGPFSLRVLRAAGISTRAELEKLGAVRAFMAAKRVEPRVTLNLLWGLAGLLTNTHWSRLPAEYRSSLLLDYDACLDSERSLAARSRTSGRRTRAG